MTTTEFFYLRELARRVQSDCHMGTYQFNGYRNPMRKALLRAAHLCIGHETDKVVDLVRAEFSMRVLGERS